MDQTQVKVQIPVEFKELFNLKWRYLVFYGGRASGKSENVARALLLRGRQRKLRILCTREIQNTIKDSVHKLLTELIEAYQFNDYEVQRDTIINRLTGTEFIFKGLRMNINEIKSTQGIDICWVEEAQSVSEHSLDVLTPTIRKKGSQIIFTFNRFTELDPVFVRFVQNPPSNIHIKQINFDILEKLGLLPDVIKQEIEDDKSNPSLYAHKWLGEPLSQSDFSIIPRAEILEAMQREIEDDGQTIIGVDVARMGEDKTVLWKRKGLKTVDFKVYKKMRTTQTCDLLEVFADENKSIEIKIDDTGVGGGVTDEMIKRGYNVTPVNFGGRAKKKNKYPNWISEAWFYMASIISQVELPMEQQLIMELSTRQWAQDMKGKRKIESKDHYKARGFRSPDMADACIICYAPATKTRVFEDKPSMFNVQ